MSDAPEPLPWFHPVTIAILAVIGILVLVLRFFLLPLFPKPHDDEWKKDHVVITGGSSGIGLGLAKACIAAGCKKVTLIARNKSKLESAKTELMKLATAACTTTKSQTTVIDIIACDVSQYKEVQKMANKLHPTPTILFNNAGTSVAHACVDTPYEEYNRLMNINYLGSVYCTKAILPKMQASGQGGAILFTSSMAGLVGVFGFTAYAPTKFALRGFAESLQMEVHRDNISVTLCFPPDTDTPGFQEEIKTQPVETRLISEAGGLFPARKVGGIMLENALKPHPPFKVYIGFEGWMLSTLNGGMSPERGVLDALAQILLMGILRLVSLFYLSDWARIIVKAKRDKMKNKKE